jgi:hypothetical protein
MQISAVAEGFKQQPSSEQDPLPDRQSERGRQPPVFQEQKGVSFAWCQCINPERVLLVVGNLMVLLSMVQPCYGSKAAPFRVCQSSV